MIVALCALFVALGGSSYAAINLPKASVGPAQLKKNSVTAIKVKDGSLLLTDIRRSDRRALRGQTIEGPQGPPGASGPRGEPGQAGSQGPTGVEGPAGTEGAAGAQGIQGIQGVQGMPGEEGPTGPEGPTSAVVKLSAGNHPDDTNGTVQCDGDRVALGGGAVQTGEGNPMNPPPATDDPAIELSAPVEADGTLAEAGDTPTGWMARIHVFGVTGRTFSVYVVCGPQPPPP